jgi:hypothetical protein
LILAANWRSQFVISNSVKFDQNFIFIIIVWFYMKKSTQTTDLIVPAVIIENKVYVIRGEKVMLDHDLAALYEVPTKQLNQAIRRNITRFTPDFMFQLTKEEESNWRSQIVTSNSEARRHSILAFTEQGIAMLSSILRSDRAILVNIQIMRAFTRMRQALISNAELGEDDGPDQPKKPIGFNPDT